MNRWYVTAFFAVLASAAPGCGKSNEPVDLGNHNTRSIGAKLSDYAGAWEGYAEAYTFNDGSDKVRVTLDANGDGTIEVGASAPLPPPDADHDYYEYDLDGPEPPIGRLVSGFSYPVSQANVADERIRFTTYGTELYREWCELLTPHSYTWEGGYAGAGISEDMVRFTCWPLINRNISFRGDGQEECVDTDENVVVPCGPRQCDTFCKCTENACSLRPAEDHSTRPEVLFDGALAADGQKLVGTLVVQEPNAIGGVEGMRIAVRLTKQ